MKKTETLQAFAVGSIAIFVVYCLGSLLQEYIIKTSYTKFQDDSQEKMTLPNFFIFVASLVSWAVSATLNKKKKIGQNNNKHFSNKIMVLEVMLTFASLLTFTKAIYLTGFPLAMMFKSCSIISSASLGVFFGGDQRQNRANIKRSLITPILVGVGLVFFCVGGVQRKQINTIGVELLLISLLCDGFSQKIQNKSETSRNEFTRLEKFQNVSKGVGILSVIYSICTGQIVDMAEFISDHPISMVHLLFFGFLFSIGQIIIFQMSDLCQQKIVDFVSSMRKLISVALSILVFKHQLISLQFIGIVVTAAALADDFYIGEKNRKFKKHYSEINKFNVSLLDDPIQINQKTIFTVQMEVPVLSEQQKEWSQRYDMLKLIEQVFPPENVIEFIGRDSIQEIRKNQAKIEDPEQRMTIFEEIQSIEGMKNMEEQDQNGSTDSSKE